MLTGEIITLDLELPWCHLFMSVRNEFLFKYIEYHIHDVTYGTTNVFFSENSEMKKSSTRVILPNLLASFGLFGSSKEILIRRPCPFGSGKVDSCQLL